ncbi:hypothetical protein QOT17_024344 [Balamuthia mandrillaris]
MEETYEDDLLGTNTRKACHSDAWTAGRLQASGCPNYSSLILLEKEKVENLVMSPIESPSLLEEPLQLSGKAEGTEAVLLYELPHELCYVGEKTVGKITNTYLKTPHVGSVPDPQLSFLLYPPSFPSPFSLFSRCTLKQHRRFTPVVLPLFS